MDTPRYYLVLAIVTTDGLVNTHKYPVLGETQDELEEEGLRLLADLVDPLLEDRPILFMEHDAALYRNAHIVKVDIRIEASGSDDGMASDLKDQVENRIGLLRKR